MFSDGPGIFSIFWWARVFNVFRWASTFSVFRWASTFNVFRQDGTFNAFWRAGMPRVYQRVVVPRVSQWAQGVSESSILQRSTCVDGLCRSGGADELNGSCMVSGVWSILHGLKISGSSFFLRQSSSLQSCRPTKFPVLSSPVAVKQQRTFVQVIVWLRKSRVASADTVSWGVLRHPPHPPSTQTIQRVSRTSASG